MKKNIGSNHCLIEAVCSYISRSGEAKLPAEVIKKAKHHILDTLAAIVSGSKLRPGQMVKKFIQTQAGTQEAQVAGSQIITSAINAAFANGIMAHADETDDAHTGSYTHPGCSIVPAALSMSEREGADGMSFLKGVVVGYDIGCRIPQAIGIDNLLKRSRCALSIGANFGTAAAAASISKLEEKSVRYIMSYTSQQASGVYNWMKDEEHIEKAFVFGGAPARNGVTSTILMQSGFTGVSDPFSGEHNFFKASAPETRPELLAEGLGERYEIMHATIKKFSVGLPIQAPLDGLLSLIKKHGIASRDVESICAHVHTRSAHVVDNDRNMPDINLQHLLAVALLDGGLNFETAHSLERMKDPAVLKVRKCITLTTNHELIPYHSIVEVTTRDGAKFKEHITQVLGRPETPMTTEMVEEKCKELMTPILGEGHSQKLIDKIWNLEQVRDIRELRPLLSGQS
jgi:2-methylcitrate dehydratase PrpD